MLSFWCSLLLGQFRFIQLLIINVNAAISATSWFAYIILFSSSSGNLSIAMSSTITNESGQKRTSSMFPLSKSLEILSDSIPFSQNVTMRSPHVASLLAYVAFCHCRALASWSVPFTSHHSDCEVVLEEILVFTLLVGSSLL